MKDKNGEKNKNGKWYQWKNKRIFKKRKATQTYQYN